MIANIFCWIFAIGILISRPSSQSELYSNMAFALMFILVGTLSKAVDTYREVNMNKSERKEHRKAIVQNDE